MDTLTAMGILYAMLHNGELLSENLSKLIVRAHSGKLTSAVIKEIDCKMAKEEAYTKKVKEAIDYVDSLEVFN